jgi:CheY-like chemotaxis protein
VLCGEGFNLVHAQTFLLNPIPNRIAKNHVTGILSTVFESFPSSPFAPGERLPFGGKTRQLRGELLQPSNPTRNHSFCTPIPVRGLKTRFGKEVFTPITNTGFHVSEPIQSRINYVDHMSESTPTPQPLPKLLGLAIRSRRHELGYSQEELAWRAGLNRTYVTDVERGARNLSLSTIDKIATALRVPLSGLLSSVDHSRGLSVPATGNTGIPVEILLVEDNPRDAEITVQSLRRARLDNVIHVARDGEAALIHLFGTNSPGEKVVRRTPHLIILDLYLPRMNGLEVLQHVKADPIARAIPVIILTGSDDGGNVSEALRLGAQSYLVKPVDFHRLSRITPDLNLTWTLQQASASISREAASPSRHSESVDSPVRLDNMGE